MSLAMSCTSSVPRRSMCIFLELELLSAILLKHHRKCWRIGKAFFYDLCVYRIVRCWEPETLIKMSGHYEDNSKVLPDDLVAILSRSKDANTGMSNMHQILCATFDQRIHTSKKADTATLFGELQQEILGIATAPGTNFAASFGHLAGGYDAQYYGYLWSEVFAMDMFVSKFKGRLTDPIVGMEYRNKILLPGGSKDAAQLLREFLGREPSQDAFLQSKGLK